VPGARFHFAGSVFYPGVNERWVSLCGCGRFHVFFPGRPDWEPDDPLTAALADPGGIRQPTPPWLRLFQLSSGHPWRLPWRHVAVSCEACSQQVTFAVWTFPRFDIRAYSTVCLACGETSVEQVYPGLAQSETAVSGCEWMPPCVAVARLRRAVFTNSPVWPQPPLVRPPSADDDDDD